MRHNPFTEALGEQIDSLPTRIKHHFGMGDGTRHYRGTMTRVWRCAGVRGFLAAPALRLASAADMLFAETGNEVGFSLSHRVQQDENGPKMVWSRWFHFPKVTRRFDAVMQYNAARGCIVDWVGKNGTLEVELHPKIIEHGIEIISGKQWLRVGRANFPLPGWMVGKATIREWIDQKSNQRIQVTVNNPLLGDFFGYEGMFTEVSDKDAPQVCDLPIPKPGIVVPVIRWLSLGFIAIAGTVAIVGSFAWTNEHRFLEAGVAVGVGASVAWIGLGAVLLRAIREVAAITWVDLCLRTMAVGMTVLSSILIIHCLLHHQILHTEIPPTAYVAIVGTSDVTMAVYFGFNASRMGMTVLRFLAFWVLILNGLCGLVIAAWFYLMG